MAKYESHMVGDSEFSFVSFPLIVTRKEYAYSELPLTIPVDAGRLILGVGHEVTTVFAGGTPAVSIGNGTSTNFWMTTTVLAPTSTGFQSSLAAISTGQLTGSSAGRVVLTGSTELSSGNGAVYIYQFDLNTNWRTTGQW